MDIPQTYLGFSKLHRLFWGFTEIRPSLVCFFLPKHRKSVLIHNISVCLCRLIVLGTLCGCGGGSGGESTNSPPSPPTKIVVPSVPEAAKAIEFTRILHAGFTRKLTRSVTSLSEDELVGGGVAAADFDDDGDVDLYVVGRDSEPNHLYVNRGNGIFEESAASLGLDVIHWGSGPAFGDIDGDGDLDLFVGSVSQTPIFLFENKLNETEGRFTDITKSSGISLNARNTISALFYDYDRDGFVDLFLTHWREPSVARVDTETIWRNNGDNTFTNVSIETGLAVTIAEGGTDFTFTPNFSDIDNDGDGDLLLTSDYGESQVFLNNDDGTFTQTTDRSEIVDQFGMGSAIGDFDNDGDFDWFVTSIYNLDMDGGENFGNRIYRNNGDGSFIDATDGSNVENGEWGWGTCAGDFDNDGFLDLVEVNGWIPHGKDYRDDPMRFYYNLGSGEMRFQELHEEVRLLNSGQGRAIACFDAERDGDLDIVIVNNSSDHIIYYRNDTDNSNSYLGVKLLGLGANRFGIGARIDVTTSESSLARELGNGNNYASHNPFEVHFGLGAALTANVVVTWPDGSTSRLNDVAVNQHIEITATESNARLVVVQGQGTGAYSPGERITIRAREAEEGYYFSHWSTNATASIENALAAITVFTMPNSTVTVRANYVPGVAPNDDVSVARRWNELLLQTIRNDYARPTVHARNLFHISAAMYDAWSAYRTVERPWLLGTTQGNSTCDFSHEELTDAERNSNQAISLAAYRIIRHRFADSPGANRITRDANALLGFLGFDRNDTAMDYESDSGSGLGNYIANCYLELGMQDGANESNDYANEFYVPVNPSLKPHEPGNPEITDLNRWQPLSLLSFIDQSGNPHDSEPAFLSPEWGQVLRFALQDSDRSFYHRDDYEYWVFHDPGPPPRLATEWEEFYKWGFELVVHWSSHLDPTDEVMIDISPRSLGNIQIYPLALDLDGYKDFFDDLEGGDLGTGYSINPKTGSEYQEQVVPRGDYARVLAEFWADGPDSETPPGHWFVILNQVNDHPLLERRLGGSGLTLDQLEWDVKAYFVLGGAMHDAAIAAWGIKGWYDYIRPISSIRAMADRGQSSDSDASSYDEWGIAIQEGYIELIESNDPLAGENMENVGKMKVRSWKGPDFVEDPEVDVAGVDWILAANWWPYQRPSFVTPPFAGYVSGHSTFSRAAAEVLTALTGDAFFPGGMSSFNIPKDVFLKFEKGPSVDMTLQWATYFDASDQCSLSRIWGGIHPPGDDIPGRLIGMKVGQDAYARAVDYFDGVTLDQ